MAGCGARAVEGGPAADALSILGQAHRALRCGKTACPRAASEGTGPLPASDPRYFQNSNAPRRRRRVSVVLGEQPELERELHVLRAVGKAELFLNALLVGVDRLGTDE